MNMIPSEVDGQPIWVEVVVEPGGQPTAFGRNGETDLPQIFSRAKSAISYLSREAFDAARSAADAVACPEQVEIQFGLKFSTQGSIIVAGSSLESSLSVKVIYSRSEIMRDRGEDGDSTQREKADSDAT